MLALCAAAGTAAFAAPRTAHGTPDALRFTHAADASAAEGLGGGLVVVANDEDNVLRVYRLPAGGAPVAAWDAGPRMALSEKSPEMDIEGSAKIGDTIYWITSHAPNKEGKPRLNRRRFFATRVTVTNDTPAFEVVGQPVVTLLADLDRDPRYAGFKLAAAAVRPPKTPGSLNIEALCDTPEGGLFIGFRSPVPGGKALLAPLLNPADTVNGKPPRFGDPVLLELGGNGIRAMARTDRAGFFIIAGSPLSGGGFRLYRWDGRGAPHPEETFAELPADATPEGLVAFDDGGATALLVVSDDGARLVDGQPAKLNPDPARRAFRGFIFRAP